MSESQRLSPELRELLTSATLAHLTTIGKDGAPQVSVIWVELDGDDIVSAHWGKYVKLRNLERDPRFVLSLSRPAEPGVFMAEYAVLKGTATVENGGAKAVLDRLGEVYVGEDFTFPHPDPRPDPDAPDGYLIRYRVEKVTGLGPWTQAG